MARNTDSLRIRNGLAVFWSRPGWRQAFHADTNARTAREAAQAHKALFPGDTVRSVRDGRGRFASFKN